MAAFLPTLAQCSTLASALLCGLLLQWLGAPLPFMFGSLGACLISALHLVRMVFIILGAPLAARFFMAETKK